MESMGRIAALCFSVLLLQGCSKESAEKPEAIDTADRATEQTSMPEVQDKRDSAAPGVDDSAGSDMDSATPAAQPSYDCSKKLSSSVEELICKDPSLAKLDRQLADVYAAAAKTQKATDDRNFKASQRGWIKGRNDCWKAEDKHECVAESYGYRIVDLQVTYKLAPVAGRATYICDGNNVTATYFKTDPPALMAEYKGEEMIMRVAPSGSGSKYVGGDSSISEHQGEATIVWGYGATPMQCKVQS